MLSQIASSETSSMDSSRGDRSYKKLGTQVYHNQQNEDLLCVSENKVQDKKERFKKKVKSGINVVRYEDKHIKIPTAL
jgi:hypothetical protein